MGTRKPSPMQFGLEAYPAHHQSHSSSTARSITIRSTIPPILQQQTRFTFGGLGNSIEAVAAGTVGDDLSFWGHAILNSDGTLELNRMFLIFSNLLGDSYAFNARVGVIEPSLFSFSTHRAWMEGYWFTTRPFSNDMGWTFEETQKGIELNGMLSGRFGYSAGIVEGFGKVHSDKDYYAHVTYKVGGMPLDGVLKEEYDAQ